MIRVKKHTLSAENETLLALAGQALPAAHKAFRAINDADFQFGSVLDGKMKKGPSHMAPTAFTFENMIVYYEKELLINIIINMEVTKTLFANSCKWPASKPPL